MNDINKPSVSKRSAWAYGIMAAFVAAAGVSFVFTGVFTPMGTGGFVAALGAVIVEGGYFLF